MRNSKNGATIISTCRTGARGVGSIFHENLKTGGNTDAIPMSLLPEVKWP